jgi:hypothetical protein
MVLTGKNDTPAPFLRELMPKPNLTVLKRPSRGPMGVGRQPTLDENDRSTSPNAPAH